ncbi:MAG TPA: hypothetical protein VGQ30_06340 [Gemmatimonadaceae bacterium]|jgi:hypothetical protein|nr:hypothetical protein [Gemmatimonadaceae bacterium]
MKCENRLILLLEAEREELEGRGTSAVATHVRECARCRAVAARLVADTGMLAAQVIARRAETPVARRVLSRPLVFGAALAAAAAAIALMLMPVRDARRAPQAHGQTASARPAVETPSASSSRQPGPLVRVRETRLPGAVAATPVRLVASQDVKRVAVGDSSGVSVIPPAGRRSAVLATRNEKITVVWIY